MKKSLIVTGASRGNGAATAILSAREGWQVCVNYRSPAEEAEETLRGVRKAGGTGIALQADVGDEASLVAMFERCDRELAPLAGLVHAHKRDP